MLCGCLMNMMMKLCEQNMYIYIYTDGESPDLRLTLVLPFENIGVILSYVDW